MNNTLEIRPMARRSADEKVEIIYDIWDLEVTLRQARTAEDLEGLKDDLKKTIAIVSRLQARIAATGEKLHDLTNKEVRSKLDWR